MKVLQGFIDIGGQANRYARALRLKGIQSESWFYDRTIKTEPFDRALDFSKYGLLSGRVRKARYLFEVLLNFDVLHIHKGYSMFNSAKDLDIARRLGKKVIIHYRGSEIRKDMKAVTLAQVVIKKIQTENSIANRIVVKDGQLAELIKPYVKDLHVFPNIVDVSSVKEWKKTYNGKKKLLIVHIPSNPSVKGTDIIRKEIGKISNQIDYLELRNLSHKDVLLKYLEADIVIDQLLTGTYGNAALEAMALGTPVLNYLNPLFTAYEPENPPILHVDSSTLCDVILDVNKNRELLEKFGKAGNAFVSKYHTYDSVGQQLIDLYQTC